MHEQYRTYYNTSNDLLCHTTSFCLSWPEEDYKGHYGIAAHYHQLESNFIAMQVNSY